MMDKLLSVSKLKRVLFFILVCALRVSKRLYLEVIREKGPIRRGKNTIIIVGAGYAEEMMLRDIARRGYQDFYPLGFLDGGL